MKLSYGIGVPVLALLAGLLAQQPAFADGSYQETTQITGGSLMSLMKMASVFSSKAKDLDKPIVSTVMVHGNKMVHLEPTTIEIIDLDNQTITNVDKEKHTYTVMTFAQLQEGMNAAAAKMKEAKEQRQATPSSGSSNVQMKFNANITSDGTTKQIDGRDAKEALLTLTMDAQSTENADAKGSMAITSEMWLISDAPGYQEVRDFQMRMAKLLAVNLDTSGMAAMVRTQPGAQQAMENLAKESSKMKGIPVMQTMRMGMTTDGKPLPPASAPTGNSGSGSDLGSAVKDGATDGAAQSASDQLAKLGGFGRAMGNSTLGSLMRHRKSQPAPAQDSSNSQSASAQPTGATLMETVTKLSGFSAQPVDASNFEVPAGYSRVEAPPAATR